jgi:hypothetical protein
VAHFLDATAVDHHRHARNGHLFEKQEENLVEICTRNIIDL